ncbi:MAG: hypothetical protein JWR35_1180, partial [Marmoricola sp.]|nr:hypothetical protein [Marmoricola sp.]
MDSARMSSPNGPPLNETGLCVIGLSGSTAYGATCLLRLASELVGAAEASRTSVGVEQDPVRRGGPQPDCSAYRGKHVRPDPGVGCSGAVRPQCSGVVEVGEPKVVPREAEVLRPQGDAEFARQPAFRVDHRA